MFFLQNSKQNKVEHTFIVLFWNSKFHSIEKNYDYMGDFFLLVSIVLYYFSVNSPSPIRNLWATADATMEIPKVSFSLHFSRPFFTNIQRLSLTQCGRNPVNPQPSSLTSQNM